jgi:hypothetical protein
MSLSVCVSLCLCLCLSVCLSLSLSNYLSHLHTYTHKHLNKLLASLLFFLYYVALVSSFVSPSTFSFYCLYVDFIKIRYRNFERNCILYRAKIRYRKFDTYQTYQIEIKFDIENLIFLCRIEFRYGQYAST